MRESNFPYLKDRKLFIISIFLLSHDEKEEMKNY